MRLINADAYLDKVCTYKTTGCGSCEFLTICPIDEPTIEAIPVEWIKRWKEKAADGSLRRGLLDLFDNYEYEAAIDRLLSDWKEENEQNKKNAPQAD